MEPQREITATRGKLQCSGYSVRHCCMNTENKLFKAGRFRIIPSKRPGRIPGEPSPLARRTASPGAYPICRQLPAVHIGVGAADPIQCNDFRKQCRYREAPRPPGSFSQSFRKTANFFLTTWNFQAAIAREPAVGRISFVLTVSLKLPRF